MNQNILIKGTWHVLIPQDNGSTTLERKDGATVTSEHWNAYCDYCAACSKALGQLMR